MKKIFQFVHVKCELTELKQRGAFAEQKTPRVLLVRLSCVLEQDMVLLSMAILRINDKKVSISIYMNREDRELANKILQTRKGLIDSGTVRKIIRLCKLELQRNVDGK